jgi:hypothetical protein
VTAVTAEQTTVTYENDCADLPADSGCVEGTQSYETTQARTDRTWWLLAPNPFVVLADAAPQLPAEPRRYDDTGTTVQARDLDPLGTIGRAVRDLRRTPDSTEVSTGPLVDELPGRDAGPRRVARPAWRSTCCSASAPWCSPSGACARRRAPSPKGQRVA